MTDETTPSPAQGTEDAVSEAPTDFRDFVKWRSTGELPEKKEEPPAAADQAPPAKTEPDSETEANQGTEDTEEDDEETPARGKGGSRQRRIDRLTREVEELKRQIAGQPVKPQDRPSESARPAAGKPKLEDFPNLQAWQEALTDWKIDDRERTRKETEARTATEQTIREQQDVWAKKEKAARKAHDDYDDLMDTVKIPVGPGVLAARQAMLEDENGAELLYHLARNPKELERIAALSPASAVMAIGKLSASLSPAPENGKPRITGAPKPPPPSGRPSKMSSDTPEEAAQRGDFRAYAKLRAQQRK